MWIPAVLASALILVLILAILQVSFAKMGPKAVRSAITASRKKIDAGHVEEAERLLYDVMRVNGWNYEYYLVQQKTNKAFNIEAAEPTITKLAKLFRVLPKNTFVYMPPAFFRLGEIYRLQGKRRKAIKLFEDVHNYIDGYGESIPYPQKCSFYAHIYGEQARAEFESKSYVNALKLHLRSYLEMIAGYKGGGDDAFQQNYPYPGDELLDDLLTALGRGNQKERFLTLTNRIVSHAVGRINTKLVEREVDNFLAGGDSVDRELIATRDIIHTALTKAQQDDEEAKARIQRIREERRRQWEERRKLGEVTGEYDESQDKIEEE